MSQNIYDNHIFFKEYLEIRSQKANYNDLLEQPVMRALFPDLSGKTVLDLGCGFGYNCTDFVKRGASKVVGIDISKRMLEVARAESENEKIEYFNMDMMDIVNLNLKFDFVYSSLAFHYVDNFKKLIADIFSLLNDRGQLLYSQEHPIITSTIDDRGQFNKDENDDIESYTFSNYNQGGPREFCWIIDGVIMYHRPMGEIITTLAKTGFIIEELVEPTPKKQAMKILPILAKEFLAPAFMVIKAKK